jgi:hypothetical protein
MNLLLALLGLYAIVYVFVLMGSRTFVSGRTIIHNLEIVAAMITVILFSAMVWSVVRVGTVGRHSSHLLRS